LPQIDSNVRDRILPAAVEVAILIEATENGITRPEYVPVGSGTIISPDGLLLTNWHVVDPAAHRTQLDAWEAQAARDGAPLALELADEGYLILGSPTGDAPEPLYVAELVTEDHALDVAALQITSDADGRVLERGSLDLPFVPLGDSSLVRQGDAVHIFGYPIIGGGTLQYTSGVVSGFGFEEGMDGRAWITTDATMAGGSNGGTAGPRWMLLAG
jgi:S1-C subfamily serine protease